VQDSRIDRAADVSWAEIRRWIFAIPMEGDENSKHFQQLESEIASFNDQRAQEMLEGYEQRNVSCRSYLSS